MGQFDRVNAWDKALERRYRVMGFMAQHRCDARNRAQRVAVGIRRTLTHIEKIILGALK